MGTVLGKNLAQAGFPITFGSRHPEQNQDLSEVANVEVASPKEAAQKGEIILLALPFGVLETTAQELSPHTSGKILIDLANYYPNRDGQTWAEKLKPHNGIQSLYVASLFPEAKVVKAFSTTYFGSLEQFAFAEGAERLAIPMASNEETAKQTVIALIQAVHYVPIDLGGLEASRPMQPGEMLFNINTTPQKTQELLDQAGIAYQVHRA